MPGYGGRRLPAQALQLLRADCAVPGFAAAASAICRPSASPWRSRTAPDRAQGAARRPDDRPDGEGIFPLGISVLHQGECVSRSELLAGVWQMSEQTGTNVVDVYVNYLRREGDDAAVGDANVGSNSGGLIETVRGAGYRLGGLGRRPVARGSGRPSLLATVACA